MSSIPTHSLARQTKVGFVGLSTQGWAANTLGNALIDPSLRNKYSLVALSTTSQTSSAAAAKKWSELTGGEVKGFFGDVESNLLSDERIDMVAVSVGLSSHKGILLPAIKAKKDFFVEWPVGKSSEETKEVAAAAREYGVRSVIGLQARQTPTIRKVKEIIELGKIGKVLSSNVSALVPRETQSFAQEAKERFSRYLSDKNSGGNLLTIPVAHQLDALTYVLGDFTSLSATALTHYPTAQVMDNTTGKPTGQVVVNAGFDHIAFTGVLNSGVLVTSSWRAGLKASTPGRSIFVWEIEGEEGTIRMQASPNAIMGSFIGISQPELFVNGDTVEVEGRESPLTPLVNNWTEFVKGEEGTHATIEDAVKLKKVIDAVEESISTGKRVDI